ncbi:general transcription factor 3C polypeptide 5-like isoform X2 [Corticium candelabrum]|uniref:general transcription factor 3C polypeptide 5-like isoform X2 n=1 Tax=Corticium candelabrum TaxID=121492 RepID=UPI002E2597BB|nr:general transcription factor 3C polypeptide 5-like isoform X2 [Corticium candelabrum]
MEIDVTNKKRFVCVLFPGNVVDIDAALQRLGGIRTLTEKRPQLQFRPGDTGSIPVWGSRRQTSLLLLHIRKRRTKQLDLDSHLSDACTVRFAGIVDTIFDFPAPADFQYLPPGLRTDSQSGHAIHDLSVTEIQGIDMLDKKQAIHIPPAVFSNISKPLPYRFTSNTSSTKSVNPKGELNPVGRYSRIRRPSHATMVSFRHNGVPTKCDEGGPHVPADRIEAGQQLFDERPVWSRVAFQSEMRLSSEATKKLLPRVAYHFTSGPWHRLWVKFGYDPRTEKSSYIYQGVDFRQRKRKLQIGETSNSGPGVMKMNVGTNLSRQLPQSREPSLPDQLGDSETRDKAASDSQRSYVFRADAVPTLRQFFYQLCDIQVEEVEQMIHDVQVESTCSEKDGWLPASFIEDVRKIMHSKLRDLELTDQTSLPSPDPSQLGDEDYSDDEY